MVFLKIKYKIMIYTIQVIEEESFFSYSIKTYVFETKELRDMSFNKSLNYYKNIWGFAKNFKSDENSFSYNHSGDRTSSYEKQDLNIINTELIIL